MIKHYTIYEALAVADNADSISEVRGGGWFPTTLHHEQANTTAPHFANCVLGCSAERGRGRGERNGVRRL